MSHAARAALPRDSDLSESEQQLRDEAAKLGPKVAARIRAVEDYIAAQVGSDLAKNINGRLVSARQIEGWERIMASASTQQRAAGRRRCCCRKRASYTLAE
jgi:hypothetical protein